MRIVGYVGRGYNLVETDEKIGELGRRYLRLRAENLSGDHPPQPFYLSGMVPTPSYHHRIEKVGFMLYAVAVYQNRLVPDERIATAA